MGHTSRTCCTSRQCVRPDNPTPPGMIEVPQAHLARGMSLRPVADIRSGTAQGTGKRRRRRGKPTTSKILAPCCWETPDTTFLQTTRFRAAYAVSLFLSHLSGCVRSRVLQNRPFYISTRSACPLVRHNRGPSLPREG